MRFVRAKPQDSQAVRAFVRSAYAAWVPVLGREPLPMTADYDLAILHHRIDLLWDGEEWAGLVELVPQQDCLFIENVAVRPDLRGKGHGKALLEHAADVARTLGLGRLRLSTNKLMASNIALYRHQGYGIDREEVTPDGRHVVHMSAAV